MNNHKKRSGSGSGGSNRQVAAAPTSSYHHDELNILESEVGKPIIEEFENSSSDVEEESEDSKNLFLSPLHSDSPSSSSTTITTTITNSNTTNNIVSSSLPTWQIEDKRKKKNKVNRSSTLASSLHSGYFKHTDNLIHATSSTLLNGNSLFEQPTTITAGPPTSPKFLRVNESIDERFNFQVINAIKQIHAEGERSVSGTHFFSSTSEDVQGILSNISSKHESADIFIEPSEIFMNFNNLSKDEVEIIISFLPLEDNLNMGLTSKYYYYLTIEDKFWKSLLLRLPQRERISMQTVLYQLDFHDNYYNYNFTDLNTVYTPLNTMSEINPVENIDDIPEIGSINDNVTKIRSRDSSFSSSKSFYQVAGQELKSSSHLKRIPLKHQYILYKHHSKTVKKKERGKRAEDKIGIFFSKRCQPCMYIQLCILSLTTLLFITLSLIFSGLYYDNTLEKESAETLLTVSPAGFSLLWLPIFFLFIGSLYLMMGWVPYLSSFFLTCYNRFHKKKSTDESTSLLHPNEEDSNAETSVLFVILRRLFFSSDMQENIDDPNYQLKMAAPSQLIWFSVLVLVIGLRFLIFKDQLVWRYLLIPVYIFQLFACVDFTYRGVRLWTLKSPFKRTISQLLTIMLLVMNVNLIYLSSGTSLVLASLKLDEMSFTEHVKWSEVLTPAYVCLLLIHFNISILPYYAAKIFYNGFHAKKTTVLAVLTPIPIVFLLLSPFTTFLILLSLRLDTLITLRYSLVLAPLYIGLSLYLLAISIYSIVKLVRSKCCK